MSESERQPPPTVPAEPWIRTRLGAHQVYEDGGKWHAALRGEDIGTFDDQAAALKAYRKAAHEKFGDAAVLPSEQDIDRHCQEQSHG